MTRNAMSSKNSLARSLARNVARAHTRRRAARPSSPDRAPADRVHRRDSRSRTPTDPSRRPPKSQTARVILRQPLDQTRRQQKRLLAIAPQEVLCHDRTVLGPSDDPPLYATASMERSSPGARSGGRAPRLGPFVSCQRRWRTRPRSSPALGASGSDRSAPSLIDLDSASIHRLIGLGSE